MPVTRDSAEWLAREMRQHLKNRNLLDVEYDPGLGCVVLVFGGIGVPDQPHIDVVVQSDEEGNGPGWLEPTRHW